MLIEAELKDRPEVSIRTIASDLGVDDTTVGDARRRLEDGAGFPHHETVGAARAGLEEIGEIRQSNRVERKGGGTYRRSWAAARGLWFVHIDQKDRCAIFHGRSLLRPVVVARSLV